MTYFPKFKSFLFYVAASSGRLIIEFVVTSIRLVTADAIVLSKDMLTTNLFYFLLVSLLSLLLSSPFFSVFLSVILIVYSIFAPHFNISIEESNKSLYRYYLLFDMSNYIYYLH